MLDFEADIPVLAFDEFNLSGYRRNTINGIAFTSSDGSESTGFNYSFGIIKTIDGENWFDTRRLIKHKVESPLFHNKPTVHFPLVRNTFSKLESMGIKIFRARLSLVKAKSEIPPHRDTTCENDYCIKIHIPLKTNPNCQFVFEKDSYHLKRNGIYLANVANTHSFLNGGDEDRYHIIADCIVTNPNLPFCCQDIDGVLAFHHEWQRKVLEKDDSKPYFRQKDFIRREPEYLL